MRKSQILLASMAIILLSGCGTISSSVTSPNSTKTQKDKVLLYFVYKDNCPSCLSMKHHMKDAEISRLVKKNYIVKMVNIRDKSTLPKVWMRPYVSPTLYFLDKNKEELISSIHGVSKSTLLASIKEAIDINNMK